MPRSTRDSDEETETKAGRRTPNPSGFFQDTSLRRSTRLKPIAKNNESSPESPVNENNTPQTRATRKRVGTMESHPVSENVRSLRQRKASVSPSNSETAVTEHIGTPRRSRRTLNTAPSVDSPKTNSYTRQRTRAGSETNSPPATTRTTRRTRASSMGPEAIGDKLMEKVQTEHNDTTVKTRRRASVMPSETTVTEAEEVTKVIKIEIERVLPEIVETNDETKISSGEEMDEAQKSKETTQEAIKGQQDDIEIVDSGENETTKNDITHDTEKPGSLNEKDITKIKEEPVPDTGKETSMHSLEEESSQDGSKDFELTIANTSHESDMSNKENETTNMISDLDQNAEIAKTTVTLQSPKPLRSTVTNKLVNEKVASPLRESIKNLESVKEAARASLDAFSSNVDPVGKIGDTENNANNSSPTQKIDERQSKHEVSQSPILVQTRSEEKVSVESSEVYSVIVPEEEPEENKDNAQTIEDTPQNEPAAKEIIDGIEITDITDVETTEMEEIDVEAVGIVDDTETSTPDELKEDEDEPMDVSILEFREIISESNMEEQDKPAEDIVGDKSIEASNINVTTETSENVKSPDKLETTELPQESEISEMETSENINAANSESETVSTNKAITDEKSLNTSTNVCESEKVSPDTLGTDASTTLHEDGAVNKDINNPSDGAINRSLSIPEIQIDSAEEKSEKAADKSPIEVKSTENDDLPDKQSTVEENSKNIASSEIDSDANTDCLFQNECATEWNKKKKQSDSESISSLATEKVEHESEAECDLVLVDRDAWLAAESYKIAKEKDMSDYDSDDTVVLKSRIDTIKDRINRSSQLQTLVEESDDDLNTSKTVRRKSLQNRRKSLTKSAEKRVDPDANSQSDENIDSNDSLHKSTSRKSLSKSLIMQKTEDSHNASLKNRNLNKSEILETSSAKKRKSLNMSVHNVSLQDTPRNRSKQSLEIDSDSILSSLSKKKKSLNKSQINDSSDDATAEPVNESIKKIRTSRSLNNSLKNREDPDKSSAWKAIVETDESSIEESKGTTPSSLTKKKIEKDTLKGNNNSKVVDVNVDSDEASIVSESDDSNNESTKIPRFLFACSDSDTDKEDEEDVENSIDSDIKKEYNLDGKDITEFDDDNVPGDECRASESEYSDSEDNGSDLADFVVGDDEVEEEESDEEDENNDEDDGENAEEPEEEIEDKHSKKEAEADHDASTSEEEELNVDEIEDNDNEKDINDNGSEAQASEIQKSKLEKSTDSASSSIIRSGKKKRASRCSILDTDDEEEEILSISSKDKKKRASLNKSAELRSLGQHLDESAIMFTNTIALNRSLGCSTPKNSVTKLERLHASLETPTLSLQAQKKSKILSSNLLSSIFLKTDAKDTVLETETPLRKLHKTKKIDKLLHKSLPTELIEVSEGTNLSRLISSNVSQLNKAAATPHAAVKEYHRKEKLNMDDDEISSKKKRNEPRTTTVDQLVEDPSESEEAAAPEEPAIRVSKKNIKVLAKAEALQKLEAESNSKLSKKLKKRKRVTKETESETPVFKEIDECPVPVPRKLKRTDSVASNKSEEAVDNVAKKKKKKISHVVATEIVVPHQVSNTISVALPSNNNQQVSDKPKKKRVKDSVKIVSTELESVSSEHKPKKQKKIAKIASPEIMEEAVEKPREREKVKKVSSKTPKKPKATKNVIVNSDDEPEAITFSAAREEVLKAARLAAESMKLHKQIKQQKQEKKLFERINNEKEAKLKKTRGKSQSVKSSVLEVPKKGVKRLSVELLDSPSDLPKAIAKKRKISKNEAQILPSRSMPNSVFEEYGIGVDESLIPLSSRGSTTQFGIVSLSKMKKQAKKSTTVASFRQKMLARNSRQPIAAYMVYLEKQKAMVKDKLHSKP